MGGNRRRKDKAHDIGDSMPGTYGDSQGTVHDRQGRMPTVNPEDDVEVWVPNEEQNTQSRETSPEKHREQSGSAPDASSEETTRMKYAKRYGDSWPVDRKRRFLREHDVTAEEMGWKLRE
jgi:hypothetical protein